MKVLNFGSVNIDHVYNVDHFVRPGETLTSTVYRRFAGGKGFNQSIALARAGVQVCHAGKVGPDGLWLKTMLDEAGVDTARLAASDLPTGHALIQVAPDGENAIVLYGGANRSIRAQDIREALEGFAAGDYLLLQNEINSVPAIIREASAQGLHVIFNPAPVLRRAATYPLDLVDLFIVNEVEGRGLTGEDDPPAIINAMRAQYPGAATVLTLGKQGAMYADDSVQVHVNASKVSAVDTTAAGDTFVGYFLAGLLQGESAEGALRLACRAAALCVTRPGAADSIPTMADVERASF